MKIVRWHGPVTQMSTWTLLWPTRVYCLNPAIRGHLVPPAGHYEDSPQPKLVTGLDLASWPHGWPLPHSRMTGVRKVLLNHHLMERKAQDPILR